MLWTHSLLHRSGYCAALTNDSPSPKLDIPACRMTLSMVGVRYASIGYSSAESVLPDPHSRRLDPISGTGDRGERSGKDRQSLCQKHALVGALNVPYTARRSGSSGSMHSEISLRTASTHSTIGASDNATIIDRGFRSCFLFHTDSMHEQRSTPSMNATQTDVAAAAPSCSSHGATHPPAVKQQNVGPRKYLSHQPLLAEHVLGVYVAPRNGSSMWSWRFAAVSSRPALPSLDRHGICGASRRSRASHGFDGLESQASSQYLHRSHTQRRSCL